MPDYALQLCRSDQSDPLIFQGFARRKHKQPGKCPAPDTFQEFMYYEYNGSRFDQKQYLFDHDITLYAKYYDGNHNIVFRMFNQELLYEIDYGKEYTIKNLTIDSYFDYLFGKERDLYIESEYDNYEILYWVDAFENKYYPNETYLYEKELFYIQSFFIKEII